METKVKLELEHIKKRLSMVIKRQEYLEDALLSAEDEKAIAGAEDGLKAGRTVPWGQIKKKRSLK